MTALIKKGIKVVIYVRVSTQEQAKEGYSIGEQIERLQKYCEAMGWEIVETFIDPGYSGGDTDRPGLQAMIKTVKTTDVDKVVVYKLDRLSRSQKDTLFLIEDVFLANNADFVSMSENFDTSTPFGRAMIGILAVFAQLEREQIKERMSMGKEARAKEGKWHGGATEPIGYDYDPATELLNVNEYEAMQVRELFSLFLDGVPLRKVEMMFSEKGYTHKHGTWDPKAMRRILRSKVYLGYNKHKDEWHKGEHTPIIDEATYGAAVNLLDQRAEHYKMTGVKPGAQTTYLGGLIHCAHCSGKYTKQMGKKRKDGTAPMYYVCYSRGGKVKKMIKDPNCKNKNWKMEDLDEIICTEIRNLGLEPELIEKIKKEKQEQKTDEPNKIAIIEKELDKIETRISRFMDLYGEGIFTIDQVNSKVKPLNEERKGLQKELESLNAAAGRLSVEDAKEITASFEEVLEGGDFNEIRATIEALMYYIEVDNEQYKIHWKFA